MVGKKASPLAPARSLKSQLKSKSRSRREGAGRLAAPGAAIRPPRNDLLPSLTIEFLPLAELRPPARQLRKFDPAHVREVAATMSALEFSVPALIGKNNVVIDGVARILTSAPSLMVRPNRCFDTSANRGIGMKRSSSSQRPVSPVSQYRAGERLCGRDF